MTTMRKILQFVFAFQVMLASAQVGVHTDTPDNSSALDIVASNRGLLIPRVTLTSSLSNPSPVTAPAVGLLVFNSGSNQAVGFYFWNGTTWVQIGGGGSSGGNDWTLTGNAGTFPGTNFLGTLDNQHFLIYTNNAERMRFESDGQIIIDSIAPRNATDLFTVIGNSVQKNAINAYSPGAGFYSRGGRYGIIAWLDSSAIGGAPGFGVYGRNDDAAGFGMFATGSAITSFPVITSHTAGITTYGYDGIHAWGRNASGYGICAMGSTANASYVVAGHAAGVSAIGYDGVLAKGSNASGRGVIAVGTNQSVPSVSLESEGGAFTGYHGIFAKAINAIGNGVIGVGSNMANYASLPGKGAGGCFTGNYGVYGKGLDTDGVGILGLGSNGGGYYTMTDGSGGAFTGYHGSLSVGTDITEGIGVVGAGNNSAYVVLPQGAGAALTGITIGAGGFGMDAASGIGVIGGGNNSAVWVPSNGCGGAFTGNTGIYCRSINTSGTGLVATGNNLTTPGTFTGGSGAAFTGVPAGVVGWGTGASGTGAIGVGNGVATPLTYASGSGGAFTGTAAGMVAYGTTAATGTGVIGAGNNVTPTVHTNGSGGAFTGTICGVYGNATATSGTRYGGYFATTNGQYAYVGGRVNNTNQKITGTGAVSTIVKNIKGDLVTLTCPEAPEVVFQDYGIAQLVDGFVHITIDPDLAINIIVDENHPLKVYITPEGNCNGVYVTNKSADGFDVIELQDGKSNIPFAWQIIATRASEEYILRDGTTEISDYSQRFAPAPGPLDNFEQPARVNQMSPVENQQLERKIIGKETMKTDKTSKVQTLEVIDDKVVHTDGNPDE